MEMIRKVDNILAVAAMDQSTDYPCKQVPCLGAKMVVFHVKSTSAEHMAGYSLSYTMGGATTLATESLALETRGSVAVDATNGTLIWAFNEQGLPIPAASVILTLSSCAAVGGGPDGVDVDAYVIWDSTGMSVVQPFWQHH